jgi:putative sterol carrier protein
MKQAALAAELTEDLDSARFSEIVRGASDRELDELLAGEYRGRVLDEIFGQMPERLKPDKAQGLDAVVHWRVGGRPGGGDDVYELTIRDGACTVASAPVGEPRVTFRIQPAAFLKLIAGSASGMKLVLGRKMRVEGDMQLAMRIERLFERG